MSRRGINKDCIRLKALSLALKWPIQSSDYRPMWNLLLTASYGLQVEVLYCNTGVVMIPGAPQLTAKDISYRINNSQAKCVFMDTTAAEKLESVGRHFALHLVGYFTQ